MEETREERYLRSCQDWCVAVRGLIFVEPGMVLLVSTAPKKKGKRWVSTFNLPGGHVSLDQALSSASADDVLHTELVEEVGSSFGIGDGRATHRILNTTDPKWGCTMVLATTLSEPEWVEESHKLQARPGDRITTAALFSVTGRSREPLKMERLLFGPERLGEISLNHEATRLFDHSQLEAIGMSGRPEPASPVPPSWIESLEHRHMFAGCYEPNSREEAALVEKKQMIWKRPECGAECRPHRGDGVAILAALVVPTGPGHFSLSLEPLQCSL